MVDIINLVKLSENEKRIIIALLLILIIVFVLIGLFVSIIRRILAGYGRGIDAYVGDMLHYQVLTKPRDVVNYVQFREVKLFIKKLLIPTGVFVGVFVVYVIWAAAAGTSVNDFFAVIGKLGIKLYWPTNKFFGLTIVSDWPKVVEGSGPHIYPDKFHVYLLAIVTIVYGFMLIRRTMMYLARIARARKMAKKVFTRNLEDLHYEAR